MVVDSVHPCLIRFLLLLVLVPCSFPCPFFFFDHSHFFCCHFAFIHTHTLQSLVKNVSFQGNCVYFRSNTIEFGGVWDFGFRSFVGLLCTWSRVEEGGGGGGGVVQVAGVLAGEGWVEL
jgi:hypothetical protein